MLAKTSDDELAQLLQYMRQGYGDDGEAPPPIEIEREEQPERPCVWSVHSRVRDRSGAVVSAVVVPQPGFKITGMRLVLENGEWRFRSLVVGQVRGRPFNVQRAAAAERQANGQSTTEG